MNKIMKHYEDSVYIPTSPKELFDYADDHKNFSSHMNKSSWMMGGGSMNTHVDGKRFRELGSHIQMEGTVFGIKLYIDYYLPQSTGTRILGYLLGGMYAKWCVNQMIKGALSHFTANKEKL